MNSRILMILTGIAGIIQSIYYYTQLPEIVASHFGTSGTPDDWMPRFGNLCVSSTIFICMTSIMFYAPKLMTILPARFINLPNRDYWMDHNRKKQTIQDVAERMSLFGFVINSFLIFITHMVFVANMSQPVKLDENTVLLALGIFMLFTAGWLFAFIRHFRKIT